MKINLHPLKLHSSRTLRINLLWYLLWKCHSSFEISYRQNKIDQKRRRGELADLGDRSNSSDSFVVVPSLYVSTCVDTTSGKGIIRDVVMLVVVAVL